MECICHTVIIHESTIFCFVGDNKFFSRPALNNIMVFFEADICSVMYKCILDFNGYCGSVGACCFFVLNNKTCLKNAVFAFNDEFIKKTIANR